MKISVSKIRKECVFYCEKINKTIWNNIKIKEEEWIYKIITKTISQKTMPYKLNYENKQFLT